MHDNCIFCKIINGSLPSFKVYEDDNFLAILDIAPSSKGHTILLTKSHISDLLNAEDNIIEKMLPVTKRIASSIKETLQCDGINILQNNAIAAGQTIFHLHIHIIPRYDNDKCTIKWDKLSYNDGEALEISKKIDKNIK